MIWLGKETFVTGMKLLSRTGPSTEIGYKSQNHFELLGLDHVGGFEQLSGFTLALGNRGIQGIKAIGSQGREARWIDSYLDIPKRRCLFSPGTLSRVSGKFDVKVLHPFGFLKSSPKTAKKRGHGSRKLHTNNRNLVS